MDLFAYEDKLEAVGFWTGVFVVVVALAGLIDLPFLTNESVAAATVQTLGIFLTIGIGLLIIQVTSTGDLRDLVPDRGDDDSDSTANDTADDGTDADYTADDGTDADHTADDGTDADHTADDEDS